MERARTRGHATAVAALDGIIAAGASHAILLSGPAGVGKTTLALDVAAALLCTAATLQPCRACRGCRLVETANHPDLHRLAPDGPGGQIRIGERANPDPGTVRRLIADLALLPVEGGARVAIVEAAHRLNDDAQSALLKTLEEPPARTTLILCTDDEERLLPTIRSRCARVRLGKVAIREIEGLLGELALADAPTAARLGRLSGGRPGQAIALASAPEAVVARDAMSRQLLDLLDATRADRLAAARDLLDAAAGLGSGQPASEDGRRRRRGAPPEATAEAPSDGGEEAPTTGAPTPRRAPVAERRRAVGAIIDLWRDLARDLAVSQLGDAALVRDPALLDELRTAAGRLAEGHPAAFLERLRRAGELLEANVSPELLLDGLLIAWPRTVQSVGASRG